MAGLSVVIPFVGSVEKSLPLIKNRIASSGFAGYAHNGGSFVVSANENCATTYSLIKYLNSAPGSMRLQIITILLFSKSKHVHSMVKDAVSKIFYENMQVVCFWRVAANVLALSEEADFEALNCLLALN